MMNDVFDSCFHLAAPWTTTPTAGIVESPRAGATIAVIEGAINWAGFTDAWPP